MSTNFLLFWSRLVHVPPRCMPPRRARHRLVTDSIKSKLPPLYDAVNPVAPAARCKPSPVALVPTLVCSRPPARNLDLLRSALSGRIMPD